MSYFLKSAIDGLEEQIVGFSGLCCCDKDQSVRIEMRVTAVVRHGGRRMTSGVAGGA
jgi:hypothetical protein